MIKLQCRPGSPGDMFVIYERPRDHPEHFVVRRWELDKPTSDRVLANSLEEAREALPEGLVNIGRMNCDDPVIVEVWV